MSSQRIVTENPTTLLPNNDIDLVEKKRKSHDEIMSECSVVIAEQQLLEEAAFHLILLQQSSSNYDFNHNNNKGYDSDCHVPGRMITGKYKKKKTQDYGAEEIVKHKNDEVVKSSSSSSSSSNETIKSGISTVSILEENIEAKDNKGTIQRLQRHRSRSIVDIYHTTIRIPSK